ncbi:hypothetical protein HYY72_05000 [Candidatus Woesearchaeota archaeon]|nr:hypothetical protein [Candidatus Woesearchaeota archaeon]
MERLINSKKGMQTSFIVVVVLVLGLSSLAYIFGDQSWKFSKISHGFRVGERQVQLFNTYAEGEEFLFYADESAKISVRKAEEELALNGGNGYVYSPPANSNRFSSPCRSYEGFPLWKNADKECFPSKDTALKGFESTITKELNEYYSAYGIKGLHVGYDYKIEGGDLIGIADSPVLFKKNVNDPQAGNMIVKDAYSYSVTPSFRQKVGYSLDDYNVLSEFARSIVDKCSGSQDFGSCAESFNGMDAGGLSIDIGCGRKQNGNIVKICARNSMFEYRFALSEAEIEGRSEVYESIKRFAGEYNVPLDIALKVAMHESGGTLEHYAPDGTVKLGDGGCSKGIMQINTCAHPKCGDPAAYKFGSSDICAGAESCNGKSVEDMDCNIEAAMRQLVNGYAEGLYSPRGSCICGKYSGWNYALRYYNGCACDNTYVEDVNAIDVSRIQAS